MRAGDCPKRKIMKIGQGAETGNLRKSGKLC